MKVLEPAFTTSVLWASSHVGLSERSMFTAGMVLLHSFLYFGVNGVLHANPDFLRPYQIERSDHQRPSDALLRETLLTGVVNRFVLEVEETATELIEAVTFQTATTKKAPADPRTEVVAAG